MDTQCMARIILESIEGDLGELTTGGAPCGAVDQWLTNEDFLLSAEDMNALAPVYQARQLERSRFDDLI